MMKRWGCWRVVGIVSLVVVTAVILLIAGWTWSTNQQIAASETTQISNAAPGQLIEINGHVQHVQFAGLPMDEDPTGAPLLLLHGFGPEGNYTWSRLLPLLSTERSLIMPELMGMGYSERILEPSDAYTHQGRSRDLAELLDQLEIEQVDLVGASYGGGVSAQFALDYPERVRKLVFLDAQVFGTGGGVFEAMGNLPLGIGRSLTWFALGMGPVSQQMLTGGCMAEGFCPTETEMAERNGRASVVGTTDALRAMSNTAVSTRLPDDLPQISQPTLVIWGENDAIIPPEQGVQLSQTIPNAQLEMISDAGHSPHMDQPEITAEKLLAFLNN